MTHEVACGNLTLSVRFLGDSALWCWEIHEATPGRLVESSWTSDWMAYGSRWEAERAGLQRLVELSAPKRPRVA